MNLCINPNCDKPQNSDSNRFCANCGSELLLAGRYRVLRQLDSCTSGDTYEVREVGSDICKVLQVLTVDKPQVVESFEKTATALKAIDYPGIIPKVEANDYFIYFPRDKAVRLHCLVMQKIEGLNLYEYLAQSNNNHINEQLAVRWLQEAVNIIQQLHNHNLLHLRINPSNFIVKADDQNLALIGFGQPHIQSENVTYKPIIAYTPPEQVNSNVVSQSDIFAVARVFAFLVTAKDPSKHLDIYEPTSNEKTWRHYASQISPKLLDLLDTMMDEVPMQRPDTHSILKILTSQQAPYIELPNSVKPSLSIKWGKFEINFLLSWMLATITGVMIGGLIGFISGFATEFMVGAITKNVTIGYISGGAIFGLITGILVGAAQSLVLHQHDYKYKWWMLVTILGFTIEGILSVLTGYGAKGEMIIIPTFAVGLFQWLVLRQHVRRAYFWVLVSSGSGAVGIAAYKGVQYFLGNAYSIFGGILGLVAFGLITGIFILLSWKP